MHVFGGHTSTIRCLEIVEPEEVDWTDADRVRRRERWPKEPLIVSGSRDHTLRVWVLPKPGEKEYRLIETDKEPSEVSSIVSANICPLKFCWYYTGRCRKESIL